MYLKKEKNFYKSLYKIKIRAIIDVTICKRFHKKEWFAKNIRRSE